MTPQFCNRGVNGGFERVCRLKLLDHALREKAPFLAIKKPPDILSRATCLLGDGLARKRPCDTGIGGSMMAKGRIIRLPKAPDVFPSENDRTNKKVAMGGPVAWWPVGQAIPPDWPKVAVWSAA
jgi:hypothetical protein